MFSYRFKFAKSEEVQFISHLDFTRAIIRAFRRANLPLYKTKGFSPHPRVTFSLPLPVGYISLAEIMDVALEYPMEEKYIYQNVKDVTPAGIHLLKVKRINPKKDVPLKYICAEEYEILTTSLSLLDLPDLNSKVKSFLGQEEIKIVYSTPKKKIIDIKDKIYKMEAVESKGDKIKWSLIFTLDNKGIVRPKELFIKFCTHQNLELDYTYILRKELFYQKDNKFIPLI